MNIAIATGNHDKFNEIKEILEGFGINSVQKDLDIDELNSDIIEEIAIDKAKKAFAIIKKPLIIDDTGVYFKAFENFPGTKAKRIFLDIGLEGLLEKLEGKERGAFFKTVICYKDKNTEKIFEGIMKGKITKEITQNERKKLVYERIFMPEKSDKKLSEMTSEEKSLISHRSIAVKKFGKWFRNR